MYIAQELRKKNIAEYLLYMWQVEDTIRAFGCSLSRIRREYVQQVDYTDETGTISTTAANAKVKNTKDITIPEGISVDFVPYVLIIALAGIALVAMKARKKEN